MSQECQVRARFFRPPPELRPFFTTFYYVEFAASDPAGAYDYLHPEWANFRFIDGCKPIATAPDGTCVQDTNFYVTGPSSRTVGFAFDSSIRMWGVGILPLGWAKFVGVEAADWANAVVDGHRCDVFGQFRELADGIFRGRPDLDAELAQITGFFLDLAEGAVVDADRISAIHGALVDPEVDSVATLVERTGIAQRTVERVCRRAFGFSPKLLLRRQRFLRSLVHYVMDPKLHWIGAMDSQYHDQAQFVRDFRQFMGMSPRQYASLDKPILSAVMRERARFAGKAVQALDGPDGAGA